MTPGDFDLLSAYLDDHLSEAERVALEKRLAADPDLRAELNHLRNTIQLLRSAPVLTPPRTFTLDPAVYRRALPWWANYRAMRVIGALGSAAAILLLTFGIIMSGSAPSPSSGAANIAILPTMTSRVSNSPAQAESTQTASVLDLTTAAAPTSIPMSLTSSAQPTTAPAAQAASADQINSTNEANQQSGQGNSILQAATATPVQKLASGAANGAAISPGASGGAMAATPTSNYAPTAAEALPASTQTLPAPLAPEISSTTAAKAVILPTATITASFAPRPTDTTQPQTLSVPTATFAPTAAHQNFAAQVEGLSASRLLMIAGVALLVFSGMLLGLAYLRSRM